MAGEPETVVLDTNIIFSALLTESSRIRETIFDGRYRFFICESTIVELFRLKDRILAMRPNVAEAEMLAGLHRILRRVEVHRESTISKEHAVLALELCGSIDPDDAPQVAATLSLDGILWTGDRKLKRGLAAKGFDRFFEPDG